MPDPVLTMIQMFHPSARVEGEIVWISFHTTRVGLRVRTCERGDLVEVAEKLAHQFNAAIGGKTPIAEVTEFSAVSTSEHCITAHDDQMGRFVIEALHGNPSLRGRIARLTAMIMKDGRRIAAALAQ